MALTHSHYLQYRKGGTVYTKYVNTTKQTTPSIAFRAGGNTYYIPLEVGAPNSTYPIGVRYNNRAYRAIDARVVASGTVSIQTNIVRIPTLSLDNGGFDQSWTIRCRAYNATQKPVPSSQIIYSPRTYSASTTRAYGVELAQASKSIFYIEIIITVFGTQYSTGILSVFGVQTVDLSLVIT